MLTRSKVMIDIVSTTNIATNIASTFTTSGCVKYRIGWQGQFVIEGEKMDWSVLRHYVEAYSHRDCYNCSELIFHVTVIIIFQFSTKSNPGICSEPIEIGSDFESSKYSLLDRHITDPAVSCIKSHRCCCSKGIHDWCEWSNDWSKRAKESEWINKAIPLVCIPCILRICVGGSTSDRCFSSNVLRESKLHTSSILDRFQ